VSHLRPYSFPRENIEEMISPPLPNFENWSGYTATVSLHLPSPEEIDVCLLFFLWMRAGVRFSPDFLSPEKGLWVSLFFLLFKRKQRRMGPPPSRQGNTAFLSGFYFPRAFCGPSPLLPVGSNLNRHAVRPPPFLFIVEVAGLFSFFSPFFPFLICKIAMCGFLSFPSLPSSFWRRR